LFSGLGAGHAALLLFHEARFDRRSHTRLLCSAVPGQLDREVSVLDVLRELMVANPRQSTTDWMSDRLIQQRRVRKLPIEII
jgi:hypothetical protein